MGDFTSQLQAVDVGCAVMVELFKADNRAETDHAADIRAAAEAAAAPPRLLDPAPSRRQMITGGLGG